MNNLPAFAAADIINASASVLPSSTDRGLAVVRRIEDEVLKVPQVDIVTHHVIHAGVYSRTICIPAGTVLTGALIKIPTTLVVCGNASVLLGDAEEIVVKGYKVLAASARRKVAYIAHADTWITMSFATTARTVEDAEVEFTDEADRLFSRTGRNSTTITGA